MDKNPDFLDGIDEQFEQLAKQQGGGKVNARPPIRLAPEESLSMQIAHELEGLSRAQQEEILAFIKTLKQKVDE